jgi:hypothetical protein
MLFEFNQHNLDCVDTLLTYVSRAPGDVWPCQPLQRPVVSSVIPLVSGTSERDNGERQSRNL